MAKSLQAKLSISILSVMVVSLALDGRPQSSWAEITSPLTSLPGIVAQKHGVNVIGASEAALWSRGFIRQHSSGKESGVSARPPLRRMDQQGRTDDINVLPKFSHVLGVLYERAVEK